MVILRMTIFIFIPIYFIPTNRYDYDEDDPHRTRSD